MNHPTTTEKPDKEQLRLLRRAVAQRNDQLEGGQRWRSLDFIVMLVALLSFAFAIRCVIVEPVGVHGPSMLPTLEDGDYMVVEKLTYLFRDPVRGEMVTVYYPNNDEYTCVKRVIGLPGETVTIAGGYVYIDGELLDEPYVYVDRTNSHDNAWTVPEDEIFVLGDNRIVSKDSSSSDVGCISQNRLVGRVALLLFPFSRFTVY